MSPNTIDQQLIYNADKCSVLMKTEIKLCLSFNILWFASFCIFFYSCPYFLCVQNCFNPVLSVGEK